MTTALIILNYNNSKDTRNCIESILRHNTAPVKIVVVDNASRTEELEALRRVMNELFNGEYLYIDPGDDFKGRLPYATLLETGENIGYGKGNNAAIKLTYGDDEIDRLLILNNDVLFVDDMLPRLIEAKKSLTDCAIISPILLKKDMREFDLNCARRNPSVSSLIGDNLLHYWRLLFKVDTHKLKRGLYFLDGLTPDNVRHAFTESTLPIEMPSGSCMLVDKAFFKEIGEFDPGTFMYFEENILFKKIDRLGRRNYIALDCQCIHLGASTTSVITNKWLVQQSKNSEMYYVKHYSGASVLTSAIHRLSVKLYMTMYSLQKALQK